MGLSQSAFLDNVEVDEAGCWLWKGRVHKKTGYGMCGRSHYAHRVAYELFVGPIPQGHHLDHPKGCPKHCCNPYTLRPVTNSLNQLLVHRRRRGQMPRRELRVSRWLHDYVGRTTDAPV